MFRLNRNERSHWSGNGVHVESELVFMIGRNMQAASVLKGKHQAAPSGIVGALAILSTFCLLTEEIVTPVTML